MTRATAGGRGTATFCRTRLSCPILLRAPARAPDTGEASKGSTPYVVSGGVLLMRGFVPSPMRVPRRLQGALGRGVLLASAAAVVAAAMAGPGASAHPVGSSGADRVTTHKAAVKKVKVDPRMFGVHDAYLNSLGRRGTGNIRLWDTGTTWPQIQPSATSWSFDRLDQIVADAWANHTEVTFVAALTPTWALAHPVPAGSPFSPGTYAPTTAAYRTFLATLMDRYKNYNGSHRPGIANYQVWNEANISNFWNETPAQMATLVKAAYQVRNAHDPSVKVLAPAMVTRMAYQQKWIKKFYRVRVAGKPVWKYADALSFNLYPLDTYKSRTGPRAGTPEDSMLLLKQVRALLAADKVRSSVPIWNTEVNYGMRSGAMGGHSAVPIPADRQVAYVIRTFLLNAAQGVRRVDWYAYDMGNLSPTMGGTPLGNQLLTDPDPAVRAQGVLTPAGKAFTRVQSWLKKGTLIGTRTKRPCIADRHGTYTCTIRYPSGTARVYWNPYGHGRVRVGASATKRVDEYGATSRIKGGSTLRVGFQPVLVKSAR